MLSKEKYTTFLQSMHVKYLGDGMQEDNGAGKWGLYTTAGYRNYAGGNGRTADNITYFSTGGNNMEAGPWVPWPQSIPVEAAQDPLYGRGIFGSAARGTIEPFTLNGDARRVTLSGDRQAGARSIWWLTCVPNRYVNQYAIGGYNSEFSSERSNRPKEGQISKDVPHSPILLVKARGFVEATELAPAAPTPAAAAKPKGTSRSMGAPKPKKKTKGRKGGRTNKITQKRK